MSSYYHNIYFSMIIKQLLTSMLTRKVAQVIALYLGIKNFLLNKILSLRDNSPKGNFCVKYKY